MILEWEKLELNTLHISKKSVEISTYFPSNYFRASSSESDNSYCFGDLLTISYFLLFFLIDCDETSFWFNENASKVNIDKSIFKCSYISKHLAIVFGGRR